MGGSMTLEQQIKKMIAAARKKGWDDAADFFDGFLIKQKVIEKKTRSVTKQG